MNEASILEMLSGIGGVGAVFAMVMFFMYRGDRKESEERLARECGEHEERLSKILEQDQESRRQNTAILTELKVLIEHLNGRQ